MRDNTDSSFGFVGFPAFGYACSGHCALAAEPAWHDASGTHRRNGFYGAMFVTTAVALVPLRSDRMEIIETALQCVPQRSHFFEPAAGD